LRWFPDTQSGSREKSKENYFADGSVGRESFRPTLPLFSSNLISSVP
jgi:hypothetical protein